MSSLRVRLIVGEFSRGWIMEKFARRLEEKLPAFGVTAEIGTTVSESADINHWILYHEVSGPRPRVATATVTHVDDPLKANLLKRDLAERLDAGICLSRQTVDELVRQGAPSARLCFITPGHDGLVHPRRITIGITSRVYADGRKREYLLSRLAQAMRLDAFHFQIFGSGWDATAADLLAAGATVDHRAGTQDYQADYREVVAATPGFDYFLYPGLDEGSMGLLDAMAAGVATIVTPQGFHLDVPHGITHPFHDEAELLAIFREISRERDARIESAQRLSWSSFAESHAALWRELLRGGSAGEFDRGQRARLALPEAAQLPGADETARRSRSDAYRRLADTDRWRLFLSRRFPLLVQIRDTLRRRR
jgi:hypothetical protein